MVVVAPENPLVEHITIISILECRSFHARDFHAASYGLPRTCLFLLYFVSFFCLVRYLSFLP